MRNDLQASGAAGERAQYDSAYRLTQIKKTTGVPAFWPTPFGPATAPAPDAGEQVDVPNDAMPNDAMEDVS